MSVTADAQSKQPTREKPRVAITVGDVAGVGPELSLACAMTDSVTKVCHPIVVGPEPVLRRIAGQMGLPIPAAVTSESDFSGDTSSPLVLDCGTVDLDRLQAGQFSRETGLASFLAVDLAIRETLRGRIDAIVTGPIQKEAWHEAETGFLGHTELLADRTGTSDFCMMLSGSQCSTVLATIHLPLADAISELSVKAVARAIRLGGQAMEKRYGRPPRITVLGLNPHAGENGLLSRGEEESIIVPAIEQVASESHAAARHWEIIGPVPPDTAFTPAMRAVTDVHICMYHDQGLIPLKALSFDDAVNVTLGLPIVRTSVDHGTAMDLAWKGKASPNSMLSAIDMAVELCR